MAEIYLVLIETSGNQNYIFSTNKLKENIGASEFTYRAGTYWVIEAVAAQNKEVLFKDWRNTQKFRKMLRENNPSLEQSNRKAEIIVAASGKSLILTRDENTARQIISFVTRKALIEAPGLDVSGVYEKIENWDKENSLAEAIRNVHKKFEQARSRRPSPVNRFLRLPVITDCVMSELPASRLVSIGGEKSKPVSEVSFAKRNISPEAKERLTTLDPRLASQIDQLLQEDSDSEKRSWLAIVHADGNGLGQIFLNFEKYIGKDKSNRNYIEKYREFSLALDECTEAAFKSALDVFPEETDEQRGKVAPIVPLIIGGDDLTVVCDGHYALEFTRDFLQKFENSTKCHPGITEIAQKTFAVSYLSACAGVAIVKRHFPFSVAYELAESLIKSAKDVKRKVTKRGSNGKEPFPCSAIDFHILYDTTGAELQAIRQKLQPQNGEYTRLYNRPYIVTIVTVPDESLIEQQVPSSEDIGLDWIRPRRWETLQKWVDLVNDSDLLPRSQAHTLRTALYLGVSAAEAQYQLIQNRYPKLRDFLQREHQSSLFHEQKMRDKDGAVEAYRVTPFLDALDAMEFLAPQQIENEQAEEAK
jgi:hypothetical protein